LRWNAASWACRCKPVSTSFQRDLRTCVILRDIEELSYHEIVDLLKIPEGTVKSRINRGRIELAKILRRMRVVEA